MTEEEKQVLSSFDNFPSPFIVNKKEYFPKKFVSAAGKKSVVWKGTDEVGNDVAIKLATYRDYMDKSYLQELHRAAILKNYTDFFAQYYDGDLIELNLPDTTKLKCICFIEEWIDGQTLDNFIKNDPVTPRFIVKYIEKMSKALNILQVKEFRHDDLHEGNVMIAEPKKETLSTDKIIKIIDLGSLKSIQAPVKAGRYDDFTFFCHHLIKLINAMQCTQYRFRKPLSSFERKFRKNAILLLYNMLDENKQIALTEPSKIIDRFNDICTKSGLSDDSKTISLTDPFDYISAEHITDDNLLVTLFAESCPWMEEVSREVPILLTGPRGCGKSTVFRRLALKAILNKNPEEIKNSRQAGFYISCSADLRNRFGWIINKDTAIKSKNEIIHYFNLLLTREIVYTLSLIASRHDRDTLFGFGVAQERKFYNFVNSLIKISEEKRLKLQGIPPMEHLIEILEYEMNSCYDKILKGYNIDHATSISYVPDLTKYLRSDIEFFKHRTITFFLDDYSIHRIPKQVQMILNPIIWDRQNHLFKLSAEKYGAEHIYDFPSDSESSPTADLAREFREIDCGLIYIQMSDKGQVKELAKFAQDLLDHRLKLAEYQGTTEKLIGHSHYDEGTLAKALKRTYPGKKDQYHGIETISQICSGDISALLEIYRRIFKDGKVDKNSFNTIPKHTQHAAIVSVSRSFLESIKSFNPYGEKMHQIVYQFGTLCHKILIDGNELVENRSGVIRKIPCETTRIEVDSTPSGNEDWNDYQTILMKELIRRSIFIDLQPGRGRRTLGPTWRWQLRRIYCPSFATGLQKMTAIKWNTSEFKWFLTQPSECCNSETKTRWVSKQTEPGHAKQFDLFSDFSPPKED
jgi:serine/threonine protein kinase